MRNANEIAKEIKEMGTWDMGCLKSFVKRQTCSKNGTPQTAKHLKVLLLKQLKNLA